MFITDENEDQVFAKFMRAHKCYDLIPTSAKLVIFDTQLNVSTCVYFYCEYQSPRHAYAFPKQALVFTRLQYKSFENTVGEGEMAFYEQFLFPQCFLPIWQTFLPFSSNLKLSSANPFNLEGS